MIQTLQNYLKEHGYDAFLVPKSDLFLEEFIEVCDERLAAISGFTGSAGLGIITQTQTFLFVDGRYTLSAKKEASSFTIFPYEKEYLHRVFNNLSVIAFDPRLHPTQEIQAFQKQTSAHFYALSENPVDFLWKERPIAHEALIVDHGECYAGICVDTKLHNLLHNMTTDYVFLHDCASVSWLFNIRSNRLSYTPIVPAFALISKEERILFTDAIYKGNNNFTMCPLQEEQKGSQLFSLTMEEICASIKGTVLLSPKASFGIKNLFKNATVVFGNDPTQHDRLCKNHVEREGFITCHNHDGLVLSQFLDIIKKDFRLYSEWSAAELLDQMRLGNKVCHSLSFPTISAMGANAAVIHYRPSQNDDKPLCTGLYLVDSGGQYHNGTTDVTRTILLGKEEIPHDVLRQYQILYTSVLKGMIDLTLAVFPKNTTGAQLDILARRYLYELGLDYPHGTGHGVGSYLNVHEGPIGISRGAHTPLEEGMVLSNEPGYYEPYQFGIRLENMMMVEKRGGFLGFRTLTQVPFDYDLIDEALLEKPHKYFLKNYSR